jgi:hypothetical protein
MVGGRLWHIHFFVGLFPLTIANNRTSCREELPRTLLEPSTLASSVRTTATGFPYQFLLKTTGIGSAIPGCLIAAEAVARFVNQAIISQKDVEGWRDGQASLSLLLWWVASWSPVGYDHEVRQDL